MSRKNVVRGFSLLDAVSLAAPSSSKVVNVINLDKASIFVDWSGSMSLDSRLYVEAQNTQDGPWIDLFPNETITLAGGSGSHQILLLELPHESIRLRIVPTAGTGTVNAELVAKTLGA